jgi:hypothetical protein
LVEAEAGFWILAPITRGLLEEAIDHTEMKMEVRIEAGAEAVEEAHGTEGGGGWSGGTGLPEGGSESPEEDMQDGAGGPGPVRLGTESTNWRTGTWGKTWSARWAAVWAMRLALHEGQVPRPLQEKQRVLSSTIKRGESGSRRVAPQVADAECGMLGR